MTTVGSKHHHVSSPAVMASVAPVVVDVTLLVLAVVLVDYRLLLVFGNRIQFCMFLRRTRGKSLDMHKGRALTTPRAVLLFLTPIFW